jgi:hypothetical protein
LIETFQEPLLFQSLMLKVVIWIPEAACFAHWERRLGSSVTDEVEGAAAAPLLQPEATGGVEYCESVRGRRPQVLSYERARRPAIEFSVRALSRGKARRATCPVFDDVHHKARNYVCHRGLENRSISPANTGPREILFLTNGAEP